MTTQYSVTGELQGGSVAGLPKGSSVVASRQIEDDALNAICAGDERIFQHRRRRQRRIIGSDTLDRRFQREQAFVGDSCRDILDRFFCRDESYKVIGEALGIPSGTIASRISRCLAKLKVEIEGRSGAPAPSSDR